MFNHAIYRQTMWFSRDDYAEAFALQLFFVGTAIRPDIGTVTIGCGSRLLWRVPVRVEFRAALDR